VSALSGPFPLGLPGPTAFYLSLYVLTLVAHVVFLSYVLAGTAWLFVERVILRGRPGTVVGELASSWLTFALSAAITAGIAPLLFLQILYKERFYTAQLLLSHRFMAILPALIVGFYLLYAQKTALVQARPALRAALVGVSLASFAFVALSWSEAYLLARDRHAWRGLYASGKLFYASRESLPRVLVWALGAVPTFAALVGLQLEARAQREPSAASGFGLLSRVALLGSTGSLIAAGLYGQSLGSAPRTVVMSPAGRPWVYVVALGLSLSIGSWIMVRKLTRDPAVAPPHARARLLGLGFAGQVLAIMGGTVLRELLRLQAIDLPLLYDDHARALEKGGFVVFAVFLGLNVAAIAWVLRAVRSRPRVTEVDGGEPPTSPPSGAQARARATSRR
jgi:hypothetical protein